MPQLIGMDEAGYGPNLGPLVITVTAWPVPGDPRVCNLWDLLSGVIAQAASDPDGRLHVGDSKQVYTPARGLKALETSVLVLLKTAGMATDSFRSLWRALAVRFPADDEQEPWFRDRDVRLPVTAEAALIDETARRLRECLDACGVGRPRVQSDVVLTRRFNRLTQESGSKGRTLSSLSLSLLRRVWEPDDEAGAFVVCDKHGGRNRYDQFLADVLDGRMIFRVEEGRAQSAYRVGRTDLRFQTKAESHFPVAFASLVSKYVRELAMLAFNDYWRQHVPDVRPTKGYPTDAKRFRADVAAKQAELGIPDELLWRAR